MSPVSIVFMGLAWGLARCRYLLKLHLTECGSLKEEGLLHHWHGSPGTWVTQVRLQKAQVDSVDDSLGSYRVPWEGMVFGNTP